MKSSAATNADTGSVMTHAASTGMTVRHFACRVVMPTPSSAPTLTCVVETGRPCRLAVVTSNAVARFAADSCR